MDPRVPTGWVKVDQLDLLIDPQPLDTVVVLDTPYPIAAGSVVGYLGEYQRYREASKLPPAPQRSLMHLEVFAGPDLPAFIKKSQARAKQLPDQKTFLEVSAGAMLVDVAEAKETVRSGLSLKPLAKDSGNGPWVKVQPTQVTMPPTQHQSGHSHTSHGHAKVKPIETPQGSPVWVERAMAGKTTKSDVLAWKDFPLQVSNAKAPAAGFDEVYSRGELDKFGAEAKAQDDKQAHWWKITVGTADGNNREGWVCDTGHPLVQWHSAWEWPGFELIDNTSVSLIDSFKRHLYVYDMLFDGDKEQFEPSAMSVNGSALITKLEKVVDVATAQQLRPARQPGPIRAATRARKTASRARAGLAHRRRANDGNREGCDQSLDPGLRIDLKARRLGVDEARLSRPLPALRRRQAVCAFLKVDNSCSVCGLDFTPHRADDLPAYLVIVIVGHIVVPLALLIETNYAPPVALQLAIYLPMTLIASLLLLQPVKGTVVGLQWALRMHGFDENAVDGIPPV